MCAVTHCGQFRLIAQIHACPAPFIPVSWLVHMCAISGTCVCHDSCICAPWLIHKCAKTRSGESGLIAQICVCSAPFMCVITRSYVCCQNWYIRVPWLIHTCAVTHSYMCHDSSVRVPWFVHTWAWLINMCTMTHSYVFHDVLIHSWYMWVPWLIHMCAMTHLYACHDSFICATRLTHVHSD